MVRSSSTNKDEKENSGEIVKYSYKTVGSTAATPTCITENQVKRSVAKVKNESWRVSETYFTMEDLVEEGKTDEKNGVKMLKCKYCKQMKCNVDTYFRFVASRIQVTNDMTAGMLQKLFMKNYFLLVDYQYYLSTEKDNTFQYRFPPACINHAILNWYHTILEEHYRKKLTVEGRSLDLMKKEDLQEWEDGTYSTVMKEALKYY